MKTIVKNTTKVSIYKFEDSENIIMKDDCIDCTESQNMIICDLNNSNATIYTGVELPSDWTEFKYTFDGTDWGLNPNFSEMQQYLQEEVSQ
jgi:hypothetical protein